MSDVEDSEGWDVDSYRTEHEPDEHWELRRRFMVAHKDRIPEDELVCLAQVMTNIEFLGCRYPNKTMQKVAELAKGVVEDFRESRKDKLKRTFVTASDAANARYGGQKRKGGEEEAKDDESPSKKVKTDIVVDLVEDSSESPSASKSGLLPNPFNSPSSNSKRYGGVKTFDVASSQNSVESNKVQKLTGPFSEFVLFLKSHQEHPVSTIEHNAAVNKFILRWRFEDGGNNERKCSVTMNDEVVATETGGSNKIAKESAAQAAINKLKEICYTIKVKANYIADSKVDSSALSSKPKSNDGDQLGSDNVGMKIMKLMGWSGGGLGSNQQGIEEPISVPIKVRRDGLGTNDKNSFKQRARAYIKKWLDSNSDQDLVFTSEFDNTERKAMHEIASQFSLKSKSYGKDEDRHLVISKNPSPWQIVEELASTGGSSDKYELVYPTKT